MCRLRTLTGNRLRARRIGSQATEVAIRMGVLNRMTALARPRCGIPHQRTIFAFKFDLCNNAYRDGIFSI